MAQKKVSIQIKRDNNARPESRFILRVLVGDKCVLAPRYPTLRDALTDVEDLRLEYAPTQKVFKVEIDD